MKWPVYVKTTALNTGLVLMWSALAFKNASTFVEWSTAIDLKERSKFFVL